jgi:septation ring formation regulator EzrA
MKKYICIVLFSLCSIIVYAQNSQIYTETIQDLTSTLSNDLESIKENTDIDIDDLIEAAKNELRIMDDSAAQMAEDIKKANFKVSEITEYLNESQKSLSRMKVAVDEMGDRMQESNEWLAAAYDDLDSADAKIAMLQVAISIKDAQLKMVPINSIWHVANGAAITSGIFVMASNPDNITAGAIISGCGLVSELIWWGGHLIFKLW